MQGTKNITLFHFCCTRYDGQNV